MSPEIEHYMNNEAEHVCRQCNETKVLSLFKQDGRGPFHRSRICKECEKKRVQKSRDNKNKQLNIIKKQGCSLCGYNVSHTAIDFHHVRDKKIEMSSYAWWNDKLKDEITKCILLCANCHRRVHAGEVNVDHIDTLSRPN